MPGTASKRWNWLDYIFLPATVGLMQAVCIAPIFAAILRDPSTGIINTDFVFWLCLGVIWSGAAVARMAQKNSMGVVMVLVGAGAAILAGWMLAIPPGAQPLGEWLAGMVRLTPDTLPVALVVLILVVLAWWRGLKTVHIEFERLLVIFAIGMVVQLGILFAQFKTAGSSWILTGRLLIFLASSMAAFSFCQISHTMREQQRRTGVALRIDRYWVMTIAGVIGGTLLLGLVVAQFVSPNQIEFLRILWNAFMQVLLLIVLVLAYLFFGLIEPFLSQITPRETTRTEPFQSFVRTDWSLKELEQNPIQAPAVLFQIFQFLVLALGIAFVIWLLVRALKKRERSRAIEGVVEERESILTTELIKNQVANLLQNLRNRRRSPFLDLAGEADTRRIVREIYQRILSRALALDHPRRKGQTPSAYAQSLLQLDSEERAAWETITRIYNIARYGASPPTRSEAQMVQAAFAKIEPALTRQDEL